jgi:GntP family gluconate:H+ symporter
MNVNIGNFILWGIFFAIPGALAAFYWTKMMTKNKGYLPATFSSDNNNQFSKDLPSPFLALLPVILPLLLITIASTFGVLGWKDQNFFFKAILFVGQPIFALFIGMLLSFLLLKGIDRKGVNGIFETAIEKAGPILIVTAAGGMFGSVIKETGIGTEAGNFLSKTGLGLAVPFLIAFLMKTAQGSSTVAIITTASFVAPMLSLLGLDSEMGKLFAILSMGAGSMMISHANDSYFWVITKFSEIETDTTLKIYSTATIVMGLTVFACIWISSLFVL